MAVAAQREAEIKQRKKEERERRRAEKSAERQRAQEQKAQADRERRQQQRAEAKRKELEAAEAKASAEAALAEAAAKAEAAAAEAAKPVETPKQVVEEPPAARTSPPPRSKDSKVPVHANTQPGTVMDVLNAAIENAPPEQRARTRRQPASAMAGDRVAVLLESLTDAEVSNWLDGDYMTGAGSTSFIYASSGASGTAPPTATAADSPMLLRQLDSLLSDEAQATAAAISLPAAKAGSVGIPPLVTDSPSSRVVVPVARGTAPRMDEESALWSKYWDVCSIELERESELHSAWYVGFREWLWSAEAHCSTEQRQEINRIKHARTHYEVLFLAQDSTSADFDNAFRRAAVRLHEPSYTYGGGGGTPPTGGANAAYRAVCAAHRILSNPTTRALYDEEMRRGGGQIDTQVSAFGADGPPLRRLLRLILLGFGIIVLLLLLLFRVLRVIWVGARTVIPPLNWLSETVSRRVSVDGLTSGMATFVRLLPLPEFAHQLVESKGDNDLPTGMDWCERCSAYHHSISTSNQAGVLCPKELPDVSNAASAAGPSPKDAAAGDSSGSGVITMSAAAVAPTSAAGMRAAASSEPLLSVELDGGSLYSSNGRVVYVPTKPHMTFGMQHQDVTDLLQPETVNTLVPLLPKIDDPTHGPRGNAASAASMGVLRHTAPGKAILPLPGLRFSEGVAVQDSAVPKTSAAAAAAAGTTGAARKLGKKKRTRRK
jgi:hypothetical protein